MEKFKEILQKEFVQDILLQGGKFYFVGGSVRDHFLNKEPKDIDVVVANLQLNQLKDILVKYGKIDIVGESFGVIVFRETRENLSLVEPWEFTGFECEIALPRKDALHKTEQGEMIIIAQSDPFMPIEKDLKRRDFTINSIVFDHELNIIDPFNGQQHLKEGIIKATDKESFVEDPLRMLRCIQFAARFGFTIEDETLELIFTHKHLIKSISPERILMEFQKVFDKRGDITTFRYYLHKSQLWNEIFEFQLETVIYLPKTLSVFLYLSIAHNSTHISWNTFYEKKLKIDKKIFAELRVLENLHSIIEQIESLERWDKMIDKPKLGSTFLNASSSKFKEADKCQMIFKCLQIAPWFWESEFFTLPGIDKNEWDENVFPKSYKQLAITGDEMITMGFNEGIIMGQKRQEMLNLVFERKLKNTKEELTKFLKNGR